MVLGDDMVGGAVAPFGRFLRAVRD